MESSRYCRILAIFNVSMVLMMISIQYMGSPIDSTSRTSTYRALDVAADKIDRNNKTLPKWVTGTPEDFAIEMHVGSTGLTDKTNNGHKFQWLYQPNLSRLIKQKLSDSTVPIKKIRLLEFGLGCAPGGGMIRNTPGGSALGWRHLFDQVSDIIFELHIFEYDKECALKWQKEHPHTVDGLHIGDASSEHDLLRAYNDAGGIPFDVMIDDASHINWHMIKTLDYMLPKIAIGGFYVVEDIPTACRDYKVSKELHVYLACIAPHGFSQANG